MGIATVIVSFVVCLSLNVFLNTFDVYSDITLTIKVLAFNLGNSLLLTGCKICHGKNNENIYYPINKSCHQCVSKNNDFRCGHSFEMLNKLNALEKSNTCYEEHFSSLYNGSSLAFDLKNAECDATADCCVQNSNKFLFSSPLKSLDRRILALQWLDSMHNIGGKVKFDIYLLSSTIENRQCQSVYLEYEESFISTLTQFFEKNITSVENKNINEHYFKFVTSNSRKVLLEKGFNYSNYCGLLVIDTPENHVTNNAEQTCESNACLLHMQRLKAFLNISNIEEWYSKTFYYYGQKIGGKICQLLIIYGMASIIPIIICIIFHLLLYLEDVKSKEASKLEIIFVFFQFYPQWKTIRFLFDYLRDRNEDKLNDAKDSFDKNVGSLEPFMESAIQVSYLIENVF